MIKLKGRVTYVLTFKNGWVRIDNTILRWNIIMPEGRVVISLTKIRRIE